MGWSMQPAMNAQWVTDALAMASFQRGCPHAGLHHSDLAHNIAVKILLAQRLAGHTPRDIA